MDTLVGILIKLQSSLPSWINPEQYDGTAQTLMIVFNSIVWLFFAVCIWFNLANMLRYPLRYLHKEIRMAYLNSKANRAGVNEKGMIWYEVLYDAGIGEDALRSARTQKDNVNQLVPSERKRNFGTYWDRAIVSILVRKDKYDERVHLYIGYDPVNHDASSVEVWASNANVEVQPIDFAEIGFVSKAPYLAVYSGPRLSDVTNEPTRDSVGSVMQALQTTMGDGKYGTFAVTLEPMRTSEETMWRRHLTSSLMKEAGGPTAAFGQDRNKIALIADGTACRATFTAFADDGQISTSRSILNTATRAIPSLGFATNDARFTTHHRKDMLRYGIVSTLFAWLGYVLGYVGVVFPVLMVVLTMIGVVGSRFLSEFWIEKSSEDGVIDVPPFIYLSPRRLFFQAFQQRNKIDPDSGFADENHFGFGGGKWTARPSTDEVIPLYRTSLMQIASMPLSRAFGGNIAESRVPNVGIQRGVLKSIESFVRSDDVSFIGISAGGDRQPVFRTIDDLNYGIAYGGNPGSGKTNALRNDFLGAARLARKETGIAKDYTINPIWFEVKPTDLNQVVDMVRDYKPRVLSLHRADSPTRLALEGPRYNPKKKNLDTVLKGISGFVAGIEGVWGDSLGPRSKQILTSAMTIAMIANPDELTTMGLNTKVNSVKAPNVITLIYYICDPDDPIQIKESLELLRKEKADKLLPDQIDKTRAEHSDAEIRRIKVMLGALEFMLSMHNMRDASGVLSPIKNKLKVLETSSGLFEPTIPDGKGGLDYRKPYSIKNLYNYGGPTIVDMTSQGSSIAEAETNVFTRLTHFLLWESIQSNCQGWGEISKKFIPIFADEVTYFSGVAGDELGECTKLIERIRNLGRSYGVSHSIGFQSFHQLPPDTKQAVLGFDSRIILSMNNSGDVDQVMADIGTGTKFSPTHIKHFPQGVGAAVTVRVGDTHYGPFAISTPYSKAWLHAIQESNTVYGAYKKIKKSEEEKLLKERRKRLRDVDDSSLDEDLMGIESIYGKQDEETQIEHREGDPEQDDEVNLTWG